MKPKLKKPKPLEIEAFNCPVADFGPRFITIKILDWHIDEAIALRKWLGEAVKYLKQQAKKKAE